MPKRTPGASTVPRPAWCWSRAPCWRSFKGPRMMRVLHVCSEIYPLLKTGGLADVAGALPLAQLRGGVDARVLVPGFPALRAGVEHQALVAQIDGDRLYRGVLPGSALPVY